MSLVVYEDEYCRQFAGDVYFGRAEYWSERARDDVADLAARRLAARNLREANKRADEAEQESEKRALRFQREIEKTAERADRAQDFALEQADKRERRLQRAVEKADERADEVEKFADEQAEKRVRRFQRAADKAEKRADEAEERVADKDSLLREYKYRLTIAEERADAFQKRAEYFEQRAGVGVGDDSQVEQSGDVLDISRVSGDSEADDQVELSGVTDGSEVVCPNIVGLLFP